MWSGRRERPPWPKWPTPCPANSGWPITPCSPPCEFWRKRDLCATPRPRKAAPSSIAPGWTAIRPAHPPRAPVHRDRPSRTAVRQLVSRFFRNSPELLVLNLLEDEELSRKELRRIRAL